MAVDACPHLIAVLVCTLAACGDADSAETTEDTDSSTDQADGGGDGDDDGDTDGDGDGDTDDGCPTPNPLVPLIFNDPTVELTPGESFQYDITTFGGSSSYGECATYRIEPEGAGAGIDAQTGVLSVDEDVPDSSVFWVSAEVVNWPGPPVEGEVFVYLPQLHPLVGKWWTEIARIPCEPGPEFKPDVPISILEFDANGAFRLVWEPFEAFDYEGEYSSDFDSGALSLSATHGLFVPEDIDGEGSYTFEGAQLVLHDLWLGTHHQSVQGPACGHRFE